MQNNDETTTFQYAWQGGYLAGRIDETLGKEYDDRTPLTKRREAERKITGENKEEAV